MEMRVKDMRKWISFSMCMILLLLWMAIPSVLAEDEKTETGPVNLSEDCQYDSSAHVLLKGRISNENLKSHSKIEANGYVSIMWNQNQPVDFVFYQWMEVPQEYFVETLDQNGQSIEKKKGQPFWTDGLAVGEGVYGVRLSATCDMDICSLMAYSGGAPEDYHAWSPTVEKADFLVISMHPDDDCIFMGAIMPIYGAEKGYEGSILYMSASTRVRNNEAANGAWTMGLRTYPLYAGMRDITPAYAKKYDMTGVFNADLVAKEVVYYLRMVKPEVVMTHDVNGEYGHWQHKVLSAAVQKAVLLAADAEYDPETVELYGTWQVKKLYLHLYEQNAIAIEPLVPLKAFHGKNAWEIAQMAYDCHKSQNHSHHPCNNQNEARLADYGLAFSVVGNDTGLNDFFENIDSESLIGPKQLPSSGQDNGTDHKVDAKILDPQIQVQIQFN